MPIDLLGYCTEKGGVRLCWAQEEGATACAGWRAVTAGLALLVALSVLHVVWVLLSPVAADVALFLPSTSLLRLPSSLLTPRLS